MLKLQVSEKLVGSPPHPQLKQAELGIYIVFFHYYYFCP